MADEKPGGTEAAEAEVAREEAGTEAQEQQQEEQAEPEAITALASEMGWTPKADWRGDPDDWKPATEFIKAGRDINRSLSRELKGMREQLGTVVRTTAQITADKIAERDAYWQGIHRKAVEDGDVQLAERAVTERDKLRDSKPQQDSGPPPETLAFIERNKSWFGTPTADGKYIGGNSTARTRAMVIAKMLGDQGIPFDEQLEQVQHTIRQEFPNLFPKPAKPPAGVQTGQSRSSNGSGNKVKGYHDMPAESQKLAQDYLERHGVPLEKFAESYWQQNDGRKVG